MPTTPASRHGCPRYGRRWGHPLAPAHRPGDVPTVGGARRRGDADPPLRPRGRLDWRPGLDPGRARHAQRSNVLASCLHCAAPSPRLCTGHLDGRRPRGWGTPMGCRGRTLTPFWCVHACSPASSDAHGRRRRRPPQSPHGRRVTPPPERPQADDLGGRRHRRCRHRRGRRPWRHRTHQGGGGHAPGAGTGPAGPAGAAGRAPQPAPGRPPTAPVRPHGR